MAIQAVITGDIVNSTLLEKETGRKLTKQIQQLFRSNKFEFYRGDSFQAYIKNAAEALRLALQCRTAAISLLPDEAIISTDIRISIGIGKVIAPVRQLKTAKGEAFALSGRAYDEIVKSEKRLAITAGHSLANEALQVIADYLNAIFSTLTSKQAEVIYALLRDETQQSVAEKLKKTKSTIHQRVVSGRWPEIEKLLRQYENIINQLT
jgi:hypothetical protein